MNKMSLLRALHSYRPDMPLLCDTCKNGQAGYSHPECSYFCYPCRVGHSKDGTGAVVRCGPNDIILVYPRFPERPAYKVVHCIYYEMSARASYREYINSPAWREKRNAKLREAGWKCERCGSAINLSVHHITYAHLKNEPMDDLVVLCRDCHASLHGKEAPHD